MIMKGAQGEYFKFKNKNIMHIGIFIFGAKSVDLLNFDTTI